MKTPSRFSAYFEDIYGNRWPAILAALSVPERQVRRLNRFLRADRQAEDWNSTEELEWLPGCIWLDRPRGSPIAPQSPMQSPSASGIRAEYVMDPASVLAARALEVQPGDEVLDLCAAPGGKTLILLEALNGSGRLVANELSSGRRERLKRVIQQHVPRESRDPVFIQGKDGTRMGLIAPATFDRILVDAPCSGERHLVETPAELATWTPRRSENLARRQYALLTSALLALRPGGTLAYSTCSISPLENDGVIRRLLERKGDQVVLDPIPATSPWAETTQFGQIHLPDHCGFGPIYFARLRKLLA